MDNVVKLTPTLREQKPEPDEEVVALLSEWLERAKAGEVRALALSGVTYDKCTVSGFTYNGNLATLLGAVTLVQHRLLKKFED